MRYHDGRKGCINKIMHFLEMLSKIYSDEMISEIFLENFDQRKKKKTKEKK